MNYIVRLLKPYRDPDIYIGSRINPYLKRWYLIPRNKYFNIYLHQFLRSDDDRALHSHPWYSISILLQGKYIEKTGSPYNLKNKGFRSPSIIFRSAEFYHRLCVPKHSEIWTLFVTGPKIREWDFDCPGGKVIWTKFVDEKDHGIAGEGCGEFS